MSRPEAGRHKVRCSCGAFLFEVRDPGPQTQVIRTCRECKSEVTWTHARIVAEKRAATVPLEIQSRPGARSVGHEAVAERLAK